jgi:hypothetical protein
VDRSTFDFHIARAARDRYGFSDRLFSVTANVVIADLAASRDLSDRMNAARIALRPEHLREALRPLFSDSFGDRSVTAREDRPLRI